MKNEGVRFEGFGFVPVPVEGVLFERGTLSTFADTILYLLQNLEEKILLIFTEQILPWHSIVSLP